MTRRTVAGLLVGLLLVGLISVVVALRLDDGSGLNDLPLVDSAASGSWRSRVFQVQAPFEVASEAVGKQIASQGFELLEVNSDHKFYRQGKDEMVIIWSGKFVGRDSFGFAMADHTSSVTTVEHVVFERTFYERLTQLLDRQ